MFRFYLLEKVKRHLVEVYLWCSCLGNLISVSKYDRRQLRELDR